MRTFAASPLDELAPIDLSQGARRRRRRRRRGHRRVRGGERPEGWDERTGWRGGRGDFRRLLGE